MVDASQRQVSRVEIVAAAVIFTAGVALRLAWVLRPLTYDEASNYLEFARHGPWFAWSHYPSPNNHVLHTLAVWLSTTLFGDSPAAIRVPAVLAGAGVLAVGFLVMRRMHGPAAALIGLAILAADPMTAFAGSVARGYSIATLAAVAAIGLMDAQRDRPTVGRWVALGLIVAAGAFTVPTMLYPAAAVFAWGGLSALVGGVGRPDRKRFLIGLFASAALAGIVTLLLYAPILHYEGQAAISGNRFVRPISTEQFSDRLGPWVDRLLSDASRGVPGWGYAVAALAVAGSLLPGRGRRGKRDRVPLVFVLILTLAVLLVVGKRLPPARAMGWAAVFLAGPAGAAVAAVTAAAGGWILDRAATGGNRERLRRMVVPAVAVLLAAGLLIGAARAGAEPFARRIGTFNSVGPVLALLERDAGREGDQVTAYVPEDVVLKYAITRADGPLPESIMERNRRARRVFVVVQDNRHRSADEQFRLALRVRRIDPKRYAPPVLLKDFGDVSVFLLDSRAR